MRGFSFDLTIEVLLKFYLSRDVWAEIERFF